MTIFVWPPLQIDTSAIASEATLLDIKGAVDQLEGYVDGIETLIGTSNTNTGNIATDVGLIKGYVDGIEGKIDSLIAFGGATFFTKPYDQIVPSTDATHDYYTSKLAAASQQVLTITYSDATKATISDISVTNH